MKRRKLLSMVMALTLVTGAFVGCGSSADEKKNTGSADSGDKEPITLTLYTVDATEDIEFTDDIAKKITELTGVTLKIEHPVGGDEQAIPLMIASGEYPDLIYAKGDTQKLIDAGAILKLDDYIDESGDNLKALYGDQINRLKCSADDPSIYTVGTYGVSNVVYNPDGNLQIQNKVLKELGYPEIHTLQQYEDAVKAYMEAHPTTESGEATIGLSLMASDWRWLITCGNKGATTAGYPDDGQYTVNDETGEAEYKFTNDKLAVYFKWLCHMNDIGLLDPESFTQKEDAYKAKISSGRVIGLSDASWDYSQCETTLVSEGKEEDTYAPLSVMSIDGAVDQSLKDYGFTGGWGVAISSSCKDPDRAFEFLDWLASDEAQVLLNWGIEGEHYTVNEDGKREVLPEVQEQKNTDPDYSKKSGIGKYVYPFPQRGDGAVDSTGNTYTTNSIESYVANYNSAKKETLAAYGYNSWCDMFPAAEELGISNHGQVWGYSIPSDLQVIQQKADDYCQEKITQAILGSPDDFDAAWQDIQNYLDSIGIEDLNAGITKLVQEKMELWGTK